MPSSPARKPTPRFRGRYPATAPYVGVIRGEVEAVAREHGVDGQDLADIQLAVSEAATNAIVHGSAGRDDARIGVRVDMTAREMLVTIDDEGHARGPGDARGRGIGAGLPIIAAVSEHLEVRTDSKGTHVEMTFSCPAADADAAAERVHEDAVQRLDEALAEQDRLGKSFDAAVGTSTEFGAYVRLQDAGEQVTARQAWVTWVEHESERAPRG